MKKLIVANWKCNPASQKEAKNLFGGIAKGARRIKKAETVVCPPFAWLAEAPLKRGEGGFTLGAQNCFYEQKGAFTGEVSPVMLKDAGCKYVIIGHSERRKYFGETDEVINKKIKAGLDAKLKIIFCVGETKEQRDGAKTEIVVKNQIAGGLQEIGASKMDEVVIAYEPVWAIGTGNACSVEESQRMRLFIIKVLSEIYNPKIAGETRVLYGGSATSQNSARYLKEAGFGGLLVGGASLNAEEFVKIIKSAE
jgi:triosephosphate isomerase (TIM)